MTDFVLRRDIKYVQWGRTLQVMLVRAIGAAVVMSIFFVFTGSLGEPENLGMPYPLAILYVIGILTFASTFIYPWIGLICWWLLTFFSRVENKTRRFMTPDNGVLFLPLILLGAMMLMLSDPLAFVLHKVKPGWIPVEKYGLFNPVPIMFVVDDTNRKLD